MLKYFVITLFLFVPSTYLKSQGFDWQWSARCPINNPQNYYGINANYGFNYFIGSISFNENNVSAPNFIDINGNNFGIGINYEHWGKYNRYAFYGTLRYNNLTLSSYTIDNVPLTDDIIAQYKISLDYNFNLLTLHSGINYRILETHFLLGAGIGLGAIVNNVFYANEEILGPAEVPPFPTNPPSYKREITTGELKKINSFFVNTHIKIGYNLDIGKGSYIEPNLCFSIPLGSMFSTEKLSNYAISFGINYYTSLYFSNK